MAKISIVGQISEMEREIALRERVYPQQVAAGKMKQAQAEMLMDRARAILATLMFCQEHLEDFRTFIAAKKAGEA